MPITSGGLPGVVRSTDHAVKETGHPQTVVSIVRMEHFLVKFFDTEGDAHVDVLLRVGDDFYASPFGEEWCAKLGPAMSWLSKDIRSRIMAKERGVLPSDIPSKDSVNVTGSKITNMTKKIVEDRQG